MSARSGNQYSTTGSKSMGVDDTQVGDLSLVMRSIVEDAISAFTLTEEYKTGPWIYHPEASNPRSFTYLASAFYHCNMVAVARLFSDDIWINIEDLPASNHLDKLEEHAVAGLTIIESRMPFINIEAVLFIPLLMSVALEVRSMEARARVRTAFDAIKAKGFAVAGTYMGDIEFAWTAVPSQPE